MPATTRAVKANLSTGTGRQVEEFIDVAFPGAGTGRTLSAVGCLSETVLRAAFTDGGSTSGTYQMLGEVPAGAVLLITKITPVLGFTGDTSAAITVGDGSDVDRYNTGTPSVFTTAANGVECGIVSGTKLITTANRPTLTVTSAADFTNVSAGSVKVEIFYIEP